MSAANRSLAPPRELPPDLLLDLQFRQAIEYDNYLDTFRGISYEPRSEIDVYWPIAPSVCYKDKIPPTPTRKAIQKDGQSPQVKVIPTKYKGVTYRSRTEARWAVFLDENWLDYEYEKEGFQFDDGTRYLPDFWLPEWRMWIEVKGASPTIKEKVKCQFLAISTFNPVLLVIGTPVGSSLLYTHFGACTRDNFIMDWPNQKNAEIVARDERFGC